TLAWRDNVSMCVHCDDWTVFTIRTPNNEIGNTSHAIRLNHIIRYGMRCCVQAPGREGLNNGLRMRRIVSRWHICGYLNHFLKKRDQLIEVLVNPMAQLVRNYCAWHILNPCSSLCRQ